MNDVMIAQLALDLEKSDAFDDGEMMPM